VRPTFAALIAASPVLAARCPQGQFYRVRLDECVSLSSPLARPYRHTAIAGKIIERLPEADPPVTADPPTADPPPDEVDEAAWRTIPLLRTAEARWAAMVSPPHDKTPPPDPWPWLNAYGLEASTRNNNKSHGPMRQSAASGENVGRRARKIAQARRPSSTPTLGRSCWLRTRTAISCPCLRHTGYR
jgi:hypothetical protein